MKTLIGHEAANKLNATLRFSHSNLEQSYDMLFIMLCVCAAIEKELRREEFCEKIPEPCRRPS